MLRRGRVLFVLVAVASAAVAFAAERPVAVSPGSAKGVSQVELRCPTFNWAGVAGTRSYELVVYAVGEEDEQAEQVLRQTVPGTATGWTPSLDACLERGGRYAWSVRAVGGKAASEWSQLSLFAVVAGPSEEEVEEALRVVRQYLGEEAGRREGASAEAAKRSPGSVSVLPRGGPVGGASLDPSRLVAVGDSDLQVNGSPVVTVATLGAGCLGRRWLDQGNGTVLDCNTRKIWLKDANCLGKAPWTQPGGIFTETIFIKVNGLNAGTDFGCADYAAGTYDDWRVPTISELCSAGGIIQDCPVANYATSLVDNRFGSPHVSNADGDGVWTEGDAFVRVQDSVYWSATEVDASSAWCVDLDTGAVDGVDKTFTTEVWPVRDGQ